MIEFRDIVPERMKLVQHPFPEHQYIKEVTEKKQVVWHHTVSGPGVRGDISWWESTKERVATPIIIDADGTMHQLFNSSYWAHHLGIQMTTFDKYLDPKKFSYNRYNQNTVLNKAALGIELDNWGQVKYDEKNDRFVASPNKFGTTGNATVVPKERVIKLDKPFKGYEYWERYGELQLESAAYLTAYWCIRYRIELIIPENYEEFYNQMYEVNTDALSGKPGLYTHCSYRTDKFDLSPQATVYPAMVEAKRIFDKHV